MSRFFIGLDPSMSSTAITYIKDNDVYSTLFSNKGEKILNPSKEINFIKLKSYEKNEERFEHIALSVIRDIQKKVQMYFSDCEDFMLGLEGYSFASKGLIATIGEFCGQLKYQLWKKNINFELLAPTTIKKFFIKGNAKKEDLLEHLNFLAINEPTSIYKKYFDLLSNFFKFHKKFNNLKKVEKSESPLSDLLDSFIIAQYMKENFKGG